MIQKRAGRTLDVSDEPFAIFTPELAMLPADNLALEPYRGCGLATASC